MDVRRPKTFKGHWIDMAMRKVTAILMYFQDGLSLCSKYDDIHPMT